MAKKALLVTPRIVLSEKSAMTGFRVLFRI